MNDNLRILAVLPFVWFLFTAIHICANADQQPAVQAQSPSSQPTTLPTITVNLLGSISAINGEKWPLDTDGKPTMAMVIEYPHIISIRLPSGRTISHFSKLTFIERYLDIIEDVNITASDKQLPLSQAISQLDDILSGWDAELIENTKRNMVDWKKDGDLAPGSQFPLDGGATLHGEPRVALGVTIGPSFTGWYVSLDVCISGEEFKKILRAEYAQSQPSTTPSPP